MPSSLQKPHVKEPFCLGAGVDDSLDAGDVSSSWVMEGRAACLRPRSLAVRADTLEMILPRVDELSDEKVRMLALSKMLGVSSDFTEEKVLEVTTDAPSLTGRHDVSDDSGKSN
jgi:hypothetical protein